MKKYNLDGFLANIFDWVNSFKLGSKSGIYTVIRGNNKPSLYGSSDMVYNLKISGLFDDYLTKEGYNEKDWIEEIQSYQRSKSGWFKEGLINYGLHFKEHSTAFAISSLRLLGASPRFKLEIEKNLRTEKKLRKWLNKKPEWGLLYWSGSHRGGGIGAIFATLGKEKQPHDNFFEWYFDWLDNNIDPKVGFWRLGWIHELKKKRLTKHELGGSAHYFWIYEFFNRPFPFPEKAIDSTLKLQNRMGTWDKEYSYCIDLDAIFFLTRCYKQTNGYRENEIEISLLKYLDHVVDKMNNKTFLFNVYTSAHKLTGYACAIAEIQKFRPDWFDNAEPWIQPLDITPWI